MAPHAVHTNRQEEELLMRMSHTSRKHSILSEMPYHGHLLPDRNETASNRKGLDSLCTTVHHMIWITYRAGTYREQGRRMVA